MKRQKLTIPQEFNSYVMKNVLFKISFLTEFHAQTAVEAVLTLHSKVEGRLDQIEKIIITTRESGHRIIDKIDGLANSANKGHCIQYMAAVPLMLRRLNADDYEDGVTSDRRIDALRVKMQVEVDDRYIEEYLESDKRSITNAVRVFFKDGTSTKKVEVEYPIGHKRRRSEGIPPLIAKSKVNPATRLSPK